LGYSDRSDTMPKLISHTADACSYELQRLHRHGWLRRRHQLLLGLWLTCSGFTWPGRVPHLSYQAAHGTVQERVDALRVLAEYPGQASRDACLAGLEDGASEVRAQAAQCAGAAGDERAATSLLDLADAKDPLERAAALEALGRLAPARALPSIERALADDRHGVRVAAVRALSAYVVNGSFEISKLTPLSTAQQVEVRLAAVELLATNLTQAAAATRVLQLRAAVKDKDPDVRAAALRVMGRIGDAKHLPDLSAALTDADEAVRLAAIAALGDSHLSAATALLRPLAAERAPLRAARTALAALGRIDDPNVLPLLAAALSWPDLTQSAASALVARAQRINQQETYQQSITAIQRAIDSLPPASRSVSARDSASSPNVVPTLAGARASAAPTLDKRASDEPSASARDSASGAAASSPEQRAIGSVPGSSAGAALTSKVAHGLAAAPSDTKHAPDVRGSTARDAAASRGAVLTARSAGQEPADAALDALAEAASELAPFADVRGVASSLVRVLRDGRGAVDSLTRRLLSLLAARPAAEAQAAYEQLFAALLEREPAPFPDALTEVLVASADAPKLVAAHREQLGAQPATSKLHALLHTSETETSLDARRALTALWAEQPALAAQREHLERLVRWLDDADPEVSERSSIALGRAADTAAVELLSARLERDAPRPELTLRACAGALLRGQLPSALRERLLQQFQSYLSKSDETVAVSAIFALRAARDQRTAPWIAGLLRGHSPQLRAAAIQALAGFDQPEARRMLRDMLRGDNVHNATNAALALAELGSDRDVEALLRAAERGSWPLPPAAAYATARITARGVTRKHSLERVLCRFAQLRDSYVLSNIVSALASLGADACDEQIQPKKLLDPTLPSSVRAAAGLWLQSTRPHSPEETKERSVLLAQCVSDHDRAVAAACRPSVTQPTPPGQTIVRAYKPDANTPLANRVLALRHPDGTVFVGQTDNAGSILLPRAAPNQLRLEDPADHGPLALPARGISAP
jgi:HEAT repeat protein